MIIFQNLSRIIIPSRKDYIDNIISRIVAEINSLYLKIIEIDSGESEFLSSFGFGLSLAIDEALKNAIEHGNKSEEKKLVKMEYYIDADKIQIKVKDQGDGFDYNSYLNASSAPEAEAGRGLLLIRNFMDEVTWNDPGNEITMIKTRKSA
ncbi:MAG: ATP-binding protein [Candidatus Wallbacteria bacterium]|nr:ATP-binding protein [Candidatus Wallbacteria bacterium]